MLGGIDIHFDNALATTPVGNPARIPDGLKAIGFGVVYLGILRWMGVVPRARRATQDEGRSARKAAFRVVGVLTITYLVFVLWLKGWSSPWQLILFPLVLLLMPNGLGIGFVLIIGLVNQAEWPVFFSRGLWVQAAAAILLRTLLLAILLIELAQRYRRMGAEEDGG